MNFDFKKKVLCLCLSGCILFWLLDAMLDYHYKNHHESLLKSLLSDQPAHEFYWRILMLVTLTLIGIIVYRYSNIIDTMNNRYSALFNHVNDPILTLNIDDTHEHQWTFSEVNHSASVVLGYRTEELSNLALADLVTSKRTSEVSSLAEALKKEKHILFEAELVRKDGGKLVGEISMYPFDAPGKPRALLILRDFTTKKGREEASRASGSAEKIMASQLPSADRQGGLRTQPPLKIRGRETASSHHVIISGTGRAGTTFLVQLLTALKLDTGFDSPESGINANSNAGMEIDIRQENWPYIVKSPWLCDALDDTLKSNPIVIDHAIVPMRDLHAAAESRRAVSGKTGVVNPPGGLWLTKVPEEQESALLGTLYKLFLTMADHDIPVTLLRFPSLVKEPEYLYRKIHFLFPNIGYEEFLRCFRSVSRPELVHDFK